MGMDKLVETAKDYTSEFETLIADPRIVVIGCGGAGCNSIDRLHSIGVWGAETIALNTDRAHLEYIRADKKVLLGKRVTHGRGAGGQPEVGEFCAEESRDVLERLLRGVDMTFITVGMGGGTGTGVAPVVAEVAKELGSVVVSMATLPFKAEGILRNQKATVGLGKLKYNSDSTIVLDNDRLVKIVPKLPIDQAFSVMDQLISEVIKNVSEAITQPSMINLDYADLRTVMCNGGASTIIYGESSAHDPEAVVADALSNPLIEVEYSGANNALVHLTVGPEMNIRSANKVMEEMTEFLGPSANVIFGARVDEDYIGQIKIMSIINGVDLSASLLPEIGLEPEIPVLNSCVPMVR
jgi:cell division protein FtsZ